MKSKILYSLLMVITLLNACRKSDDNPKIPTLERVPVPSLSKDLSGGSSIIVSDLNNFVGKVNVDLFFKSDAPPKSMDLVATKNGDFTNVKVLKSDITTFPSVASFTGPELLAAFGSVETCDFFDIGVNITTPDGKVYEAFPAVGEPYGAGVSGQYGGVQTRLNFATKVEFDPAIYSGNFTVVSDEFADFVAGETVVLTPISATSFSILQPAVKNPLPIIFNVDPETLAISITKQKIGDWFLWEPSYTNPTIGTIASNAINKVSPCSQSLTVAFDYNVDQGGFGEYVLELTKQ